MRSDRVFVEARDMEPGLFVTGSRIWLLSDFRIFLRRRRRSFSTIRAPILTLPRSRTRERIEPITRPRMTVGC